MLLTGGRIKYMRILYIANARMPTEKAHGLQIVKSVIAWKKLGVDVKLLVPRRCNEIAEKIEDYYSLPWPIEMIRVGGHLRFLEKFSHRLYFRWQRLEFGICAILYSLSHPSEAVYSRQLGICTALSLLGKMAVYEDHEPRNSWRWLYGFFLKLIKRKILVAENLRFYYEQLGIDRNSYQVAPNGVDLEEFSQVGRDTRIWSNHFNLRAGERVVLYVGHFYKWKGVYTLLDAASLIQGWVVMIGGTKEDSTAVRKYMDDHNIHNVSLGEFLPHHEVIQYLKSADVLVLPNIGYEERSARYTTPLKLFEYLAAGVPLVASDLPSFSNYLRNENNCLLVPPDNREALAAAINRLLGGGDWVNQEEKKAGEQVKAFSWDARMSKIHNFIIH